MERTAIRSREIAIVGYDRESYRLEIAFRRGGVYHYENVPEFVYEDLLQAPSQGTYFEDKIKSVFPCTKVR